MKKIAIIGSGFFGLGAALVLSKKYNIDLYEIQKDIMRGVSSSNQLRFHLGYHYPRSPETLKEVQKNNKDFIKFYGKDIFGKTKNYYGVSNKSSLTSYKKYIEFWKNFGPVIKEGLYEFNEYHDQLLPLLRFQYSENNNYISLDEYLSIFFLSPCTIFLNKPLNLLR